MERKNKLILFLLIVLVMGGAMLLGFGLTLFGTTEAEIVLPTPISSDPNGGEEGPDASGLVQSVRVTPETVQNVIATLERPENYARTVTVELSTGGDRSGIYTASVLVDGAWTSVWLDHDFQPMGQQRTIVYCDPETGEGTLYRWYGSGGEVVSWPAKRGEEDLAQHIPTYEDVLELDPEDITDAGFVIRDSVPCIYVEVEVVALDYLERYWVSTENGLLVAAETSNNGVAVIRMRSTEAEVLQTADEDRFTLPDGTVLHRQGE